MDSRPNFLIVILDSARPDWLSCYSGPDGVSPNIDRVAAEGILFEQAISPSSWTFPVMASVFTGMLPCKHGGHDEHVMLDSDYPTMAEIFERAGYDTAAFSDVPYVGPMTKLSRGFATMSNMRRHEVSFGHKILKGIGRAHRTLSGKYQKTNETPVAFGEAMRWLESRRDRGKPFMLYLHSDETHAPFLPPKRYRRRFSGLSARQMHAINQDNQLYVSGAVPMSQTDFDDLRALALAEVAYTDAWVGKLLARVQRLGLAEETAIVIAADHGDNLGEHGLLRHGMCLYDTLLRVPLILKLPGCTEAVRVEPMVQLIDLLPTLMALASIDEPDTSREFHGRDLLVAMRTESFADFAVSELYRPDQQIWRNKVPDFLPEFRERFDRTLRSYRTNTHKLIWSSNGRHELYDLKDDPGETKNLIQTDAQTAARLQSKLNHWLGSFDRTEPSEPAPVEPAMDERVMERLRDLGYVE